jgi:hypothetical protein
MAAADGSSDEHSAGASSHARPLVGVAERELSTPSAAGAAGLVFAVLFVAGVLLLYPQPAPGSTPAQVAAWYLHGNRDTLGVVGLYLVPFAGIAFLWFVAAVRARIGAQEDRFFATVFLGAGILFVGLLYAAAAATGAPLAAVRFQDSAPPSADVIVFARGLGYTLFYVYAVRAAAVFMIVSSTIGLRTGTLPRWLVLVGYAVAVLLLLSISFSRGFVLIFPGWVALVSIELLRRAQIERRASGAGAG